MPVGVGVGRHIFLLRAPLEPLCSCGMSQGPAPEKGQGMLATPTPCLAPAINSPTR